MSTAYVVVPRKWSGPLRGRIVLLFVRGIDFFLFSGVTSCCTTTVSVCYSLSPGLQSTAIHSPMFPFFLFFAGLLFLLIYSCSSFSTSPSPSSLRGPDRSPRSAHSSAFVDSLVGVGRLPTGEADPRPSAPVGGTGEKGKVTLLDFSINLIHSRTYTRAGLVFLLFFFPFLLHTLFNRRSTTSSILLALVPFPFLSASLETASPSFID
jgi:hypothetical protein